jgi:hypothetical protein
MKLREGCPAVLPARIKGLDQVPGHRQGRIAWICGGVPEKISGLM